MGLVGGHMLLVEETEWAEIQVASLQRRVCRAFAILEGFAAAVKPEGGDGDRAERHGYHGYHRCHRSGTHLTEARRIHVVTPAKWAACRRARKFRGGGQRVGVKVKWTG